MSANCRQTWVKINHTKYTGNVMYVATPLNKFASTGVQLDVNAVSRTESHQCLPDSPLAILCQWVIEGRVCLSTRPHKLLFYAETTVSCSIDLITQRGYTTFKHFKTCDVIAEQTYLYMHSGRLCIYTQCDGHIITRYIIMRATLTWFKYGGDSVEKMKEHTLWNLQHSYIFSVCLYLSKNAGVFKIHTYCQYVWTLF